MTVATLSENCSLLGTDNVRGQISEHIFASNGGYCLYIYPILFPEAVVLSANTKNFVAFFQQSELREISAWLEVMFLVAGQRDDSFLV